mgnify:FL=1
MKGGMYDSPETPATEYPVIPEPMERAALDAIFGASSRQSIAKPFVLLPPAAVFAEVSSDGHRDASTAHR